MRSEKAFGFCFKESVRASRILIERSDKEENDDVERSGGQSEQSPGTGKREQVQMLLGELGL